VATANNITQLPAELVRKGRFDELFFVDLPGADERKEILKIHLSKRRQDPSKLDLDTLVAKCKGFSGAEIEQAVKDGMYVAFMNKNKVLTTDILMQEIHQSIPLSESMKDMIDRVKELAAKVRFASNESLHSDLNPRCTAAPVIKNQTSIDDLIN
jgi:SpoVK/Ycf46/Vps4 family AAA+-type ATPase